MTNTLCSILYIGHVHGSVLAHNTGQLLSMEQVYNGSI